MGNFNLQVSAITPLLSQVLSQSGLILKRSGKDFEITSKFKDIAQKEAQINFSKNITSYLEFVWIR